MLCALCFDSYTVWFTNCVFFRSICCGSLEYYDKTYDRVNVKNEKPLQRIDRIFHTVTTTDDPVIRKLSKTEGNVYATDAILATLMCCTRSNYSWDIVIEKIGDKLFLDKRDNTEFGNLQSHYFIWQLLLAISSQLNCCINIVHSASCTHTHTHTQWSSRSDKLLSKK